MFLDILAWIFFGMYVLAIVGGIVLILVNFVKGDRKKTVEYIITVTLNVSIVWAIIRLYSQGLLW